MTGPAGGVIGPAGAAVGPAGAAVGPAGAVIGPAGEVVGPGGERRGRVAEFDAGVGLGVITAPGEAGGSFPFHCTQIAGGSRTIEVGAEVGFSVVAGRLGRWEAAGVTPVGVAPVGG